ncbi:MAG TPA: hypothetical protein DD473_00805 [Planctomycetaceae bacterium]|nr:hypothetical protein [Planctomycetaceae bacterium]
MHRAIRPFLISLLLVGLSSLWVGGSAWHSLTCSHTECCHDHRHSHDKPLHIGDDVPEKAISKRDVAEDESHPPLDSPLAPEHDEENCPICQWHSLCLSVVSLPVALVSNECLTFALDFYSSVLLINRLSNALQPRAPPMISSLIA